MRGTRAKALRRTVRQHADRSLSLEPRYQSAPRTERIREAMVPQLQADGTTQMVKVQVPTCTFRLAPDCIRFYQQHYKRAFVKGQLQ